MTSLSHHPLLGVLVGTCVTATIQSSAATIGIILALATQGLISLEAAIPVLFGCNIGTCDGNTRQHWDKQDRQTDGSGTYRLQCSRFDHVHRSTQAVHCCSSGDKPDRQPAKIDCQCSHALQRREHCRLAAAYRIHGEPGDGIVRGPDVEIAKDARYLDHRMLENSSVALRLAVKEMTHMADLAKQMLVKTRQSLFDGNTGVLDEVDELEDKVDNLKDQIIVYLSTLVSQRALTEHQSSTLAGLMHAISDIERVADHAENIAGYAREKSEKSLPFSDTAITELRDIYDRVVELFDVSVSGLAEWDRSKLARVWEFEEAIDDLQESLRSNHILRLNRGTCYPGSGVVFIEVINNLERMADHCINIAEVVFEHKGPPSFDGKASREHASGSEMAAAGD